MRKAGQTVREQGTSQEGLYQQMMKLKAAHLLAIFALAYVGAEVTLGGSYDIQAVTNYILIAKESS